MVFFAGVWRTHRKLAGEESGVNLADNRLKSPVFAGINLVFGVVPTLCVKRPWCKNRFFFPFHIFFSHRHGAIHGRAALRPESQASAQRQQGTCRKGYDHKSSICLPAYPNLILADSWNCKDCCKNIQGSPSPCIRVVVLPTVSFHPATLQERGQRSREIHQESQARTSPDGPVYRRRHRQGFHKVRRTKNVSALPFLAEDQTRAGSSGRRTCT